MVIATRSLAIVEPDGTTAVPDRLFAPEETGSDWTCRYEIDWPDGTRKGAAVGWDAVQSLLFALQMIGSELYASEYHEAGTLAWDKPGDGYGFPVSWNVQDIHVGNDRYL